MEDKGLETGRWGHTCTAVSQLDGLLWVNGFFLARVPALVTDWLDIMIVVVIGAAADNESFDPQVWPHCLLPGRQHISDTEQPLTPSQAPDEPSCIKCEALKFAGTCAMDS